MRTQVQATVHWHVNMHEGTPSSFTVLTKPNLGALACWVQMQEAEYVAVR